MTVAPRRLGPGALEDRSEEAGRVDDILLAAVLERRTPATRRPFVVGLAGSQGSGKSTAAALLRRRLQDLGLQAAVLSLDDLYLPRTDRERLAAEVHPLLLTRGPPGTHDVRLGCELIASLAGPDPVRLPRFDKARDDRRPESEWEVVQGPLDVLVFEGWCVGLRSGKAAAVQAPINGLEREEENRMSDLRPHYRLALPGDVRAVS